jgi:hypothetical protein
MERSGNSKVTQSYFKTLKNKVTVMMVNYNAFISSKDKKQTNFWKADIKPQRQQINQQPSRKVSCLHRLHNT